MKRALVFLSILFFASCTPDFELPEDFDLNIHVDIEDDSGADSDTDTDLGTEECTSNGECVNIPDSECSASGDLELYSGDKACIQGACYYYSTTAECNDLWGCTSQDGDDICNPDPCGNGIVDPGEDCDGDYTGAETCLDNSFPYGEMSCVSCSVSTVYCYSDPTCADVGGNCISGVTATPSCPIPYVLADPSGSCTDDEKACCKLPS